MKGRDTCNGSCESASGCNCLGRDYIGSDESGPMYAGGWAVLLAPFVPVVAVIAAVVLWRCAS